MRIEYTKGERASRELLMVQRETSEATSGRKMKVMLIFPPDWFPSEPYLSLPPSPPSSARPAIRSFKKTSIWKCTTGISARIF